MRPLAVILDNDPATTVMWHAWGMRKATISGSLLTVTYGHGELFIEAVDPQFVCDLVFSHEQKSVFVKGKLGITSVRYVEKKDDEHATGKLRAALKALLECDAG